MYRSSRFDKKFNAMNPQHKCDITLDQAYINGFKDRIRRGGNFSKHEQQFYLKAAKREAMRHA